MSFALPMTANTVASTASSLVGVKRSALLAARSGGDKALRTLARVRRCDLGELWQSVCDFDSDYG